VLRSASGSGQGASQQSSSAATSDIGYFLVQQRSHFLRKRRLVPPQSLDLIARTADQPHIRPAVIDQPPMELRNDVTVRHRLPSHLLPLSRPCVFQVQDFPHLLVHLIHLYQLRFLAGIWA
jgi:hypothetical protein